MSYGIEVTNSDNRVIIDSEYKNFQVKSDGTTVNGGLMPTRVDDELVFAKPTRDAGKTSGYHLLAQQIPNNSTSRADWKMGVDDSGWPDVNWPDSYTWFILAPSVVTAGTGYGVEVFDASGDLCFSSNISESIEVVASGTIGANGSYTYDIPAGDDIEDYYVYIEQTFAIDVFGWLGRYVEYHYGTGANSTGQIKYLVYPSGQTQVSNTFFIVKRVT